MSKAIISGGVCLRAVAAVIFAASAQAAAAQESTGVSAVEEIVVTAQRRQQNLQIVPISITALSADSISANRIQDVRDLSAVAPNLTVRPSPGGNSAPNYSMRGLFPNGAAVGVDKGIALYIDGVYVQAASGSVFELADIERIEVLRGPQGTLFGRNATGGAISIITRDPTGEFGVRQDFTYGNYRQFRSKTHVELPQLGPISAAVTYLHSERRGDTRNLGAGVVWDYGPATNGRVGKQTSPKYLGDQNVEAVFAAVKLDLHPDLDLTYKFDYSQNDYTPEASGLGYLAPSFSYGPGQPFIVANPFLGQSSLNNSYPATNPTPVTTSRPKAVNNSFTTPAYNRVYGHNLTAQFHLNDEITLKNILAYRNVSQRGSYQLDGLGGILTPAGLPYVNIVNSSQALEKQWSNEFQLNITTDWFNITAGYLHFQDKFASGGYEGTYNNFVGLTTITGAITSAFVRQTDGSFAVPSNPGYKLSRVKQISDAVFVQPEFHITDQLDLFLGGRITRDKKNGLEYKPITAFAGGVLTAPISYRRSHANYLIGLNYQVTPDILTYVKYATGYVSGGQLATIAFAPETAKSLEGGIKADLFDRRWRSNLAMFDVKYRNIQYTTAGQIAGVASATLFAQAVIPSADGRAWGFEWENTIVPTRGVTLNANVGYTNFRFRDGTVFNGPNPAVPGGFVLQSGTPGYLEFSRPKWTGNLAVQYDSEPMVHGGRLRLRLDGNYRSQALMTSDVSLGVLTDPPALSGEAPGLRSAATAKGYWLVNGRAGLVDMEFAGKKVEVAVWGRNLFDNKTILQFVSLYPAASVIYERARTFGVDLAFRF